MLSLVSSGPPVPKPSIGSNIYIYKVYSQISVERTSLVELGALKKTIVMKSFLGKKLF